MYACMLYIHGERERGRARARLCMCACERQREREREKEREREREREREGEKERENKQPCFAIIVVICAKETPTTYSGTIPVSKISVSFFKISKFQPRGRHFSSFAK